MAKILKRCKYRPFIPQFVHILKDDYGKTDEATFSSYGIITFVAGGLTIISILQVITIRLKRKV